MPTRADIVADRVIQILAREDIEVALQVAFDCTGFLLAGLCKNCRDNVLKAVIEHLPSAVEQGARQLEPRDELCEHPHLH
jgi:hypothetical protein